VAPKTERVKAADLKVGIAVERREHPTLPDRTLAVIARDHIIRDKNAYSTVGGNGSETTIVLNQKVRAVVPRRKKPVQKQQQDTGPGWIPAEMRIWG
jgi:hypothetical protein